MQKFHSISSKNEKVPEVAQTKTGEGNFIVEGENLEPGDIHHLSDDEEKMSRR